MLDAAIVGLGRWGQRLVDSVQEAGKPRGELIRFVRGVTRTPAKAAAFCEAQKLPLGDDYEAVLRDPAVKAVVLATPHTQHAEQVIKAAAAGKQVFVDKPFTLDKSSAERAVAACDKAGVVMALGHNRRFLPAMAELKRMIDAGELGQVLHIEGNVSGPGGFTYKPDNWRASAAESPAGGMAAMGIHGIDAFIHLRGRIASVQAQSLRQELDLGIDDTTSMLLRFSDGSSGYLATIAATARTWRIEVFGTKGFAHMRDPETLDIVPVSGKAETKTWPETDIERLELEAFARAVAGGPAYPLTSAEAVHGIAVLEAIVTSAAEDGARVKVA